MELYVLNRDFNVVSVVSNYKSVIWAKRYIENGDCEMVVPATAPERVNRTLSLAALTKSDYVDIKKYSRLSLNNISIPRTGSSPAHFGIYFYKNGTEQALLDMDALLDGGNSYDVSEYDGLKFYIAYSGGATQYDFDYTLKNSGSLDIYKPGNFIVRNDDDMICRIKDITLQTDEENGDTITVKAYDMKSILDQRQMSKQVNTVTKAEYYQMFGNLINQALIYGRYPTIQDRFFYNCVLERSEYWDVPDLLMSVQDDTYGMGEFIRKYCTQEGVGIKVYIESTQNPDMYGYKTKFYLQLYQGQDKTTSVRFSDELGNLTSSKYTQENNTFYNACQVKTNDSEETNRYVFSYPDDNGGFAGDDNIGIVWGDGPHSTDRFEMMADADIAYCPDYETVRDTLYPNGTLSTNSAGTTGTYSISNLQIEAVTEKFKNWVLAKYPSATTTTDNGKTYITIPSAVVAKLSRSTNTESWKVQMTTVAMYPSLWNAGKAAVEENSPKETFEGTVNMANPMFKYKTDYDLGDIITIENKYGISASARIIEVIESIDESGNNLSLTFENKNISMS